MQVKLEEVEVKSGEEEEETLCSYRSKLFLYGETLLDKGTGLEPNAGLGQELGLELLDFADGELEGEGLRAAILGISEVAEEFKKKYEECQREMADLLAGEDKPDVGSGHGRRRGVGRIEDERRVSRKKVNK
ncbi:hypothetical protein ACHAW5_007939 [Stephanodiscus triporus]|uniref:RanBD1 domain-containing protein n=1 Tax=Stephanodiscus triporus TaxID=2934178 RepID=A0ABD3Q510_9STRA